MLRHRFYYRQQVSQPSQMIFMSSSHLCHMHTRNYSCSLCKQAAGDIYACIACVPHKHEKPQLFLMQADIDLELKKQAAAEHPGLCGLYHALVIAAVKTLHVEAQWGSTTGNKFRNQVR